MKRFFPSSVMLIPFVVKNYSEEDREDSSKLEQESESNPELELEE
ncbi:MULTISPECIES: hypothetical protein [Vibrio]|uniref:Uncharacterized protein n=1 Tax=Vibrio bivalvicida TaxID=1276888 RepID=A0ABV4MH96_9VIBR|nr:MULTISPECIES: hypothetical protein [Vibrio]